MLLWINCSMLELSAKLTLLLYRKLLRIASIICSVLLHLPKHLTGPTQSSDASVVACTVCSLHIVSGACCCHPLLCPFRFRYLTTSPAATSQPCDYFCRTSCQCKLRYDSRFFMTIHMRLAASFQLLFMLGLYRSYRLHARRNDVQVKLWHLLDPTCQVSCHCGCIRHVTAGVYVTSSIAMTLFSQRHRRRFWLTSRWLEY